MCDTAEFVGSLNVSRLVARLGVERDHTTRSSLHRLLLEEANNLAFKLGRLGSLQREVIEGRARIAIQRSVMAVESDVEFSCVLVARTSWLEGRH